MTYIIYIYILMIDFFDRIYEEYFDFFPIVKENFSRILSRISTILSEKYKSLKSNHLFNNFLELNKEIFKITKETILYYMKDYNLRRLFEFSLARMNVYLSTAIRLFDFWYHSSQIFTYSFSFLPESGSLAYSQTLPIYWTKFKEFPSFMNLFTSLEEPSTFDITLFYIQAHNFFREFFKAIKTRTLLPPFAATAIVIGNNQVKTFDDKYYSFSANCDYILTQDFNHDRFSVVANYENQKRKSIQIKFEDNLITMYSDGKVERNNSLQDLPVIFQETYIHREGNKISYINSKGLIIICNLVHEICIVKISGWSFGKVGGLLGVYDNEPSNEFMTLNRTIALNLRDFISSWKSPVDCPDTNNEILYDEPSEWDRKKCSELFQNDSSHLFPCFELVDPEPYREMCLNQLDLMKHSPTSTRGFCQVTSSYIESCKVGHQLGNFQRSLDIFISAE